MSTFFKFNQKSSGTETDSTRNSERKLTSDQSDPKATQHLSLKGSFESMNSMDLGISTSKCCYICLKKFNFRKKHICKFCMNAVCSDHSAKVRAKEGMAEPQRICDFCDQEEEKTMIKNEIDDEVSRLGEELKSMKETNEKLYKEHFEKTSAVNQIEEELSTLTMEHKAKMDKIKEDVDKQKQIKADALEMLGNLKMILEISKANENKTNFVSESKVKNTEDLGYREADYGVLASEQACEIEKVKSYLKESLNVESFAECLCSRCSNRIKESLNKVKMNPVWEITTEEAKINQKTGK